MMVRHIARVAFVAVALLLTPIAVYASTGGPVKLPEPGTLALLSVGAGAAGVMTWVRSRRKK